MNHAEAPAPSRANASVAGIQFSTHQADGATTRALDLADTPASHIRNVLQLLELAAEWTRNGVGKRDGSVILTRQNVTDIENRLVKTIGLLDTTSRAAQLAGKRGFEPAGVLIVDEDGKQTSLALAVPRQSAPAFARKAGAR